ncbi:MAG: HEPN domain-containing protein [Candidatus Aminicenantes bacterium]|nr:HEPN domain-containing protein [Candidatus Aminicenantes bacterium]
MNWEKDIIKYRRQKAADTLEDARILAKKKRWSSAVNRIYYAVFYEVIALLQDRNLSSSKHSGVRSLLNKHFVKPGLINIEIGRFFGQMYDFRQKGDYEDFVSFKEEDVKNWIEKADRYIKELDEFIMKEQGK